MTGLSDTQVLSEILWSDAELVSTNIDYDSVTFTIRESTGRVMRCCCRGYISYEALGFWDEVVIANAELVDGDPLLDRAMAALETRYKKGLPESGSPERNEKLWFLLRITLIDGLAIKVVAGRIEVHTVA